MLHRREVSRIEGFSDAVFAFAITLLVVSLEVPKTFPELMAVVRGFPTFAVCFALLFQVWWRHYKFFRSYDLEDSYTIALTGILLFVVLFYVYPLKFVWSLPFEQMAGRRVGDEVLRIEDTPTLFFVYGAGVIAVFGVLALMYHHAYRLRAQLQLTPLQALEARAQAYSSLGVAFIGMVSIAIAAITGRLAIHSVGLAGFAYFGIGVTEWAVGSYRRRQHRRLAGA